MWHVRAPGAACLGALSSATGLGEVARNNSKGCGGVMRAVPAGLIGSDRPFELGADVAHLTHDHPNGYLASGFLAAAVDAQCRGAGLDDAPGVATTALRAHPNHDVARELRRRLSRLAIELARRGRADVDVLLHNGGDQPERVETGWEVQ